MKKSINHREDGMSISTSAPIRKFGVSFDVGRSFRPTHKVFSIIPALTLSIQRPPREVDAAIGKTGTYILDLSWLCFHAVAVIQYVSNPEKVRQFEAILAAEELNEKPMKGKRGRPRKDSKPSLAVVPKKRGRPAKQK